MNYQLVSCNEIIARVDNNFDIDYSDWITRAPLWIADALALMKTTQAYEETSIDLSVIDYHVELPNVANYDIKRILGVVYEDQLLTRIKTLNPIRQSSILLNLSKSSETYSIKNGYIITSFQEGTITLYCEIPAIEYDELRMVYLPKIPNNEIAKQAIEWYLVYCMLRKGHKHPTYFLDSNNPITNPYLMWENLKKKARNSLGECDPEQREELSKILRNFVIDRNNPRNYIEEL